MEDKLLQTIEGALDTLRPTVTHISGDLFKVSNNGIIVYTNQKGIDRIIGSNFINNQKP